MNDDVLARHVALWTTDKERYLIVAGDKHEGRTPWVLIDTAAQAAVVIEEDSEVLEEILSRMRQAGVPEIAWDQYVLPKA